MQIRNAINEETPSIPFIFRPFPANYGGFYEIMQYITPSYPSFDMQLPIFAIWIFLIQKLQINIIFRCNQKHLAV